jgi:predicted RNase H-like HicB family nuclease
MERFLIVIEKAENNYSAYLPDVPGCASTGNTIDETVQNIKEALEFHLEGLAEEGISLPPSTSLEKHLINRDIILEDDVIIAFIHVPIPKELTA